LDRLRLTVAQLRIGVAGEVSEQPRGLGQQRRVGLATAQPTAAVVVTAAAVLVRSPVIPVIRVRSTAVPGQSTAVLIQSSALLVQSAVVHRASGPSLCPRPVEYPPYGDSRRGHGRNSPRALREPTASAPPVVAHTQSSWPHAAC